MYEIPHSPDMRPRPPPLPQIGLEWLLGYTGLGALGGGAAFGLMRFFEYELLWSADKSMVVAWALVASVCGPLAIVIQQRALRSSGLRVRRWMRASWGIFLLLGLGGALVVGCAAALTRRSPISVLSEPLTLLDPLETLLGGAIVLPERALVLGIRGLTGLLIGLAQAQVWRAQRWFFCMWVLACAAAGLASDIGERAGVALGSAVFERLCCDSRFTATGLNMIYGACYWGLTWLAMALVTVGPALYLVRRLSNPRLPL
jgi:hypothetical protein